MQQGVIEPSASPWLSPVVLVKKKDGTIRFCVDYRKLHEVTRKDSYPLPCSGDTIEALAGSKWFSTLDIKSGYWQVEMDDRDREDGILDWEWSVAIYYHAIWIMQCPCYI